jgi:MraZ protein
MSQFLGSHKAKLDTKGRTSVPAQFRAALRKESDSATAALILRASHKHKCVEGWPADIFASFAKSLEKVDLFDDDGDDLTTALYADAWPVEADKEGRIILPDSLVQYAGLSDSVVFMGLGRQFQIWEPDAAARRTAEARERARSRSLTLPGAAA